MSQLVLIVGPIASGKSTLADAVGEQLRDHGRAVTVLDFDRFIEEAGGWNGLTADGFRAAQVVFGRDVAVQLAQSVDVIANGPLFEPGTLDLLLDEIPPNARVSYVRLLVAFDAALDRVVADPNRQRSKQLDFLRRAYDRIGPLLDEFPPADWTFDTTSTPFADIVEELTVALLRRNAESS